MAKVAYQKALRTHWKDITRYTIGKLEKKYASKAGNFLMTIVNVVVASFGTSVGTVIANQMDKRLDPLLGFKKSNGWCFG